MLSYSSEVISAVKGAIESSDLTLAEEKTEAVVITNRRKRKYAWNYTSTSKLGIKYLGVMIDGKFSCKQHVQYAYDKASTASVALARMMPNVERLQHAPRLLIGSEFDPVLCRSSLGKCLHVIFIAKKLCAVYRKNLLP